MRAPITFDESSLRIRFHLRGYASDCRAAFDSLRQSHGVKMHSAEVRVFPIDRQIVLVREVAAKLDKLHGDTATSFWKATAGELLDRVVGSGKDRASASDEVRRFFAAVQREMYALAGDPACAAVKSVRSHPTV